MSIINSQPLIGASGAQGYQINRSVRFRSSATASFTRTPATSGNRQKFTWSGWIKRGILTTGPQLFTAGTGTSDRTCLTILSNGTIELLHAAASVNVMRYTSVPVYRDPSAWYHIVFSVDTTQATAANRVKLYVNGVLQSLTTVTAVPLNTNTYVNHTVSHALGKEPTISSNLFDGYMTEIRLIDGQQLDSSYFGQTNPATGVWEPKIYTGTYGTNGSYVNFSDNSNNTATTIGKDSSGNGNNWTPNNISVTAGATYDSMLDVPTLWADGGNGRGNYATLNPINTLAAGATVSGGNLNIVGASASAYSSPATMLLTSGKWYFEVVAGTVASRYPVVGVQTELTAFLSSGFPGGYTANGFGYGSDGNKYVNNGAAAAFGSTFTSGDVIGVAIDIDAGKVWLSKNNTWQASGDPVAGTNAAYTVTAGTALYPCVGTYNGAGTHSANFGQRPFSYTPPSGFKALNTQNLPTPTILKGNQYFDATTYTGTGTTQSITNSGAFQPDLVWTKLRSLSAGHNLVDSVRGATKALYSNLTNAETTDTLGLTAFNADGFTLGGASGYNNNGATAVGWQWKEGATQGFDIVTYTGNGVNRTISHSLNALPAMIIVKDRTSGSNGGAVYHTSLGATKYLKLFQTTTGSDASVTDNTLWNGASPTISSTVFSVGTNVRTNANTDNYVAYLFAEVAGFSKFGSYTGNANADGPFVYCGFRPRWVMIKRTDVAGDWTIWDTARNTYNVIINYLIPNQNVVEPSDGSFDIISNGFKPRSIGAALNASGGTYIYAAFAENPTKYSLAR